MNEPNNRRVKWDGDIEIILQFKLPFRCEDANAVIGGDLIRTYTIIKFLERNGKLRKIRTNTYETI
jgi:hypothetical protein